MSDQVEEIPMVQESGKNRPLIETVNVLDGRIAGCTDQLNFGVEKGGVNVTAYAQKQASVSPAGASFVLTVPTMSTIIDRVVYVRSPEILLNISGIPAAGKTVLNQISGAAGGAPASLVGIAPAPFPFHHLCQNIQATINQQSFSFDCRQQLPVLMKMLDKDVLDKYCSMCPTQQDVYSTYSATRAGLNNPFSGIQNYIDNNLPRGAFLSQMSVVADSAAQAVGGTSILTATVRLVVYEPLLMSPFLLNSSSGGENSQGLYGVQNMRFLMNFATGNNRALRLANTPASGTWTVSINSVSTDTCLDFIMLTPHASQAKSLVSRNVVPYLDTMRFTTVLQRISGTMTSQSIQLSYIPDKVLVCIRKQLDTQTPNDPDMFVPIRDVTISFANRNGILAGTQRNQLYEMSRANGCHQSWLEYFGSAYDSASASNVGLAGSVLCLSFGKDIAITEDYYAASSLGQFNFYITCNLEGDTVTKFTNPPYDVYNYEMVLVFINSGVLVNEMGSTSIYTGLLTKQQVLDAANKPTVNKSAYNRLYGSGWWSSVKSAFRKAKKYIKPVATAVKHVAGVIPHPGAQALSRGLGALGAGVGSGYSGGRFY
jgi:hypothetical protein